MQRQTPISEAGLSLIGHPKIPVITDGDFVVLPDLGLGGDTPKCRIRWQGTDWLCKTHLHRHPLEAVYEHLMARLAATLGVETADTRIVNIGGQIRLLSRWFLTEGETFSSAETFYPTPDIQSVAADLDHMPALLDPFLKMCCFDALVGNTDRNTGNWGFVFTDDGACRPPDSATAPRASRLAERSACLWQSPATPARFARSRTQSESEPQTDTRFAPMFDTVRAAMLNIPDERLHEVRQYPKLARHFWESQLHSVLPKLPFRAGRPMSHLSDMGDLLASGLPYPAEWLNDFVSERAQMAAMQLLEDEFASMLTEVRFWAIGELLRRRWLALRRHIEAGHETLYKNFSC